MIISGVFFASFLNQELEKLKEENRELYDELMELRRKIKVGNYLLKGISSLFPEGAFKKQTRRPIASIETSDSVWQKFPSSVCRNLEFCCDLSMINCGFQERISGDVCVLQLNLC